MNYVEILSQYEIIVDNPVAIDNMVKDYDILENILDYTQKEHYNVVVEDNVVKISDDYNFTREYLILSYFNTAYIISGVNDCNFYVMIANIDYEDLESTFNYIAYLIISDFSLVKDRLKIVQYNSNN